MDATSFFPRERAQVRALIARLPHLEAALAGLCAALLMLIATHAQATTVTPAIAMADGWLHKHAWLAGAPAPVTGVAYHHHAYLIDPPLPALLMLPFVRFFGAAHVNQTLFSMFFGALAVAGAWELCRRLGADRARSAWLVGFFFVGTPLWWSSASGDGASTATVIAVCCTVFAIVEATERRRGWVIGLLAGGAGLASAPAALASPAFLLFVEEDRFYVENGKQGFWSAIGVCATIWVVHNLTRWGVPFDRGPGLDFHQHLNGRGAPFGLAFVAPQLWRIFAHPPAFVEWFPWAAAPLTGMGLLWTSPALLLAFSTLRERTVRADPFVRGCWLATALVVAFEAIGYDGGGLQWGFRAALDFEPFLLALMAIGVQSLHERWTRIPCYVSIGVGVWGVGCQLLYRIGVSAPLN